MKELIKIDLKDSANKIRSLQKNTVENLLAIGKELCYVKENIPHGEFEKWVDKEFGWNPRTARRLMSAYQQHITDIKEIWGHGSNRALASEMKLLPAPKGKYNVIVIDPPWPYGTEYDPETRRVASPYPEVSIEELKKHNLPSADDCVIWLWTTHKFLSTAFELLKEWGFEYKVTLVWDKQKMGMGEWLRCQSEFCLLGIKGKVPWNLTNQRDILSIPRKEHSRKPKEFYDMVRKLCKGKMIDYFSREKHDGFDQYGNETNKF